MEPLCEVNCVDNHPQCSAISASENRARGLDWQRFEIGPRFNLARENRSRRKLHASQEKSKKEKETLTVSKTCSRKARISLLPLEKHLLRGFFVVVWPRDLSSPTLIFLT